jgi:hypothetical protein
MSCPAKVKYPGSHARPDVTRERMIFFLEYYLSSAPNDEHSAGNRAAAIQTVSFGPASQPACPAVQLSFSSPYRDEPPGAADFSSATPWRGYSVKIFQADVRSFTA